MPGLSVFRQVVVWPVTAPDDAKRPRAVDYFPKADPNIWHPLAPILTLIFSLVLLNPKA